MRRVVHLLAPGRCSLLAAGLLLFAGCGGSADTVSVDGKVTYKGQPLSNGSIAFYPVMAGRPTVASLSEEGQYTAKLAPGDYTVTVDVASQIPESFQEGDPVPPPKMTLPPEYSLRARSKLSATFKPDQSEPIDFALD